MHGKKRIFIWLINIFLILFLCGGIWSYQNRIKQNKNQLNLLQLGQEASAAVNEVLLIAQNEAYYQELTGVFATYLPGVICWGDSLTAGAGGYGTTYPAVLEELIRENICNTISPLEVTENAESRPIDILASVFDVPVVNMGVGGESASTILGRSGAIPFIISKDVTIPADKEPVLVEMMSSNGKIVMPLYQGNAGMESVEIDGIEGVIVLEEGMQGGTDYQYFFTRNEKGNSQTIVAGTQIITSGSKNYQGFIPIVFIGNNRDYGTVEELFDYLSASVTDNTTGGGRFIIIGLPTLTGDFAMEVEDKMTLEFGEQYINLREYMSTRALKDADIEPTESDIQLMENGQAPASLMYDDIHFNSIGYRLIAKLVYLRMDELGYFDEVRAVIDRVNYAKD